MVNVAPQHAAETATYIDHEGIKQRVPTIRGRLKFRISSHARLRVFVFTRDGFTCQACGVAANEIPANYDGSSAVSLPSGRCLVMDHIEARRNGGLHHPFNLRTSCEQCNWVKAGRIDGVRGKAIRRSLR